MKHCRIQYIEKKSKKIRLFKMVSGLKGNTYEEKCAELGLETLKSRQELQDVTSVHKNPVCACDRQDLFTQAITTEGPEPGGQQVKNVSSNNLPGPISGRTPLRPEYTGSGLTGTSYQRV